MLSLNCSRVTIRTSYLYYLPIHRMASQSATNRLNLVSSALSPGSPKSTIIRPEEVPEHPFKVTVIGSGNWGTTIAKVIAESTAEKPEMFQRDVNMWVYEELVNGEKLTEIINTRHENVKYLPDVTLPSNVIAVPDIVEAATGADLLVFNIPHQFLPRICAQLEGKVPKTVRAISCLKGLDVSSKGCNLLSTYITEHLGIECGALSGANLAPEIAKGKWSETTIGFQEPADFRGVGKDIDSRVLKHLFHRPYFHVRVVPDVAGVSVAGALKNIVALMAGFVEGMGWGNNAKAAVMRIGLVELIRFSKKFFPGCHSATFFEESAGVADLITTCFGGRNVKVGKYMAEHNVSAEEAEKELLNGQSCQGIHTAREVHELLNEVNATADFPLFESTYRIVFENEDMQNIPQLLEDLEDN
ncbi:unnamed protein product [Kuraishia capsulata CBS 1993]|uniref:Glycerol-3-phosphate dehydrogenase [NAD(+)] n=1 Tax=Kuraishia capsulata CBS 1993 TaxID=1382522 RepID=W6MMM3_9ASCO|nr:uncharacterized protein KUCA_T00003790001 [Kuraishia capsulata CBS 1993]CDK27811.1 unnamed protein product [Kuraishia capsulata CBS 1993]